MLLTCAICMECSKISNKYNYLIFALCTSTNRTKDAHLIANYRVPAELSSIETTEDGKSIVLGTVDGCLTVLVIADPGKPEMQEYLNALPSRNEEVIFQQS